MFTEQAANDKAYVPGCGSYHNAIVWATNPVNPTCKFFSTRRDTIAGEIEHKSKFKEKTSPGAAGYANHVSKLKMLGQTHGFYRPTQPRKTFVDI